MIGNVHIHVRDGGQGRVDRVRDGCGPCGGIAFSFSKGCHIGRHGVRCSLRRFGAFIQFLDGVFKLFLQGCHAFGEACLHVRDGSGQRVLAGLDLGELLVDLLDFFRGCLCQGLQGCQAFSRSVRQLGGNLLGDAFL